MRFRTLLIAALLVGGFAYYTNRQKVALLPGLDQPLWNGQTEVAHSAGLSSDETNSIDIYKASNDSVVYITSTVYQEDFFMGVRKSEGIGSGFLINADGQILTNVHVINGSSDVEVTLPADQSRHKATILMRDRVNDLALIKIDPKGKKLKVLTLGDSDNLQVGQKVLAIGNPFGLSGTLTTGIVSSLGRTIRGEDEELEGMIQTDASINSGNSGGPLLDSQGSVIGINTAIYGPNGGSVGIGFAMPINRAKAMLKDYTSGRRPAQPKIGVRSRPISGDWAKDLDLPAEGGLLIDTVERGSAAAAAGLRGANRRAQIGNYVIGVGGDLIIEVDGKRVEREDDVVRAASRKHAGEKVELTIIRDGRTMKVAVTLAALDEVA
ncbi:MAG: trypsin-like peptidase domain-containing protein [Acidobacteriota bacterium]